MLHDDKNLKDAKEWFEYGNIDLSGVEILYKHEGHFETVGMLLQQAVEKYLKGFLIYNGWKLVKTHDIEYLLHEVLEYDESFEEFMETGRSLSVLYMKDRYPPTIKLELSKEKLDTLRHNALTLIEKIKAKIPE